MNGTFMAVSGGKGVKIGVGVPGDVAGVFIW